MTPYTPKPLDTGDIALPPSIQELLEKLAKNAHEAWAVTRMAQGSRSTTKLDKAEEPRPTKQMVYVVTVKSAEHWLEE